MNSAAGGDSFATLVYVQGPLGRRTSPDGPPVPSRLRGYDPNMYEPQAGALRPTGANDIEEVEGLRDAHARILQQIRKSIIGQDAVIDDLLTTLLADGHCLLVGVPGLAKTLLISSLAKALHLSFNRIQFTPDLMPSDITGTDILEDDAATGRRAFTFIKGPVFANLVLADEINRTPPKTQAALLPGQSRQGL